MDDHKQITEALTQIAAYQQETNIALVRMEGKMDKTELALNAKVDANLQQTSQSIEELRRSVGDLNAFKEKHEDEHKNDSKERHRHSWSLALTAIVALGGWVLQLIQFIK